MDLSSIVFTINWLTQDLGREGSVSQPESLSDHLNYTITEAPPLFSCQLRCRAEKFGDKVTSQTIESLPIQEEFVCRKV